MDDPLNRFQPAGPSGELKKRILEEAADAPFVARLRKARAQGPRDDLGARILAAARARARRRIAIGRWLRAAAAALIALSVPANAWIGKRTSGPVAGGAPARDATVLAIEIEGVPLPAPRFSAQAPVPMSLGEILKQRSEAERLFAPYP